jgi:4-diphosphocytidyl-2-C-methyl-D-erythritol kinase
VGSSFGYNLHNDLEDTVCRLYPEIRSAKEEMEHLLKQKVYMSGSGSSLFSFFSEPEAAKRKYETLKFCLEKKSWKLYTACFRTDKN